MMHILLADAGSTKTAWRCFAGKDIVFDYEGDGINPSLMSESEIEQIIETDIKSRIINDYIKHVYFFVAGGVDANSQMKVQQAMSLIFPDAHFHIGSDLEGAAMGLLGKEKGIACILGTGSNSCLWDGIFISKTTPSLGYIAGDEGSATHIGKMILRDYVRNKVPVNVKDLLDERIPGDYSHIIRRIYHEPMPNRFLASFFTYTLPIKNETYLQNIYRSAFQEFINQHLANYPKGLKVGFVGGVAYELSKELTQVCQQNEINIFSILKNPLEKLQTEIASEFNFTQEIS